MVKLTVSRSVWPAVVHFRSMQLLMDIHMLASSTKPNAIVVMNQQVDSMNCTPGLIVVIWDVVEKEQTGKIVAVPVPWILGVCHQLNLTDFVSMIIQGTVEFSMVQQRMKSSIWPSKNACSIALIKEIGLETISYWVSLIKGPVKRRFWFILESGLNHW